MGLYERLMGVEDPRIPVHQFQAAAAEWARGSITGAQANTLIAATGAPLTGPEQTEAQALVNTVTSIPITGSATAQADGRARRALRMFEIDQVLMLAELRTAPYDTAAAVRTRLGV